MALHDTAWLNVNSGTGVQDWVCRGLRSIPPTLQSFAWPVPVAAFVPRSASRSPQATRLETAPESPRFVPDPDTKGHGLSGQAIQDNACNKLLRNFSDFGERCGFRPVCSLPRHPILAILDCPICGTVKPRSLSVRAS